MLLSNLTDLHSDDTLHVSICGEHIQKIGSVCPADEKAVIHFDSALVTPGLINSHDHLDFNCFQPLGSSIFNNYTEWGEEIHQNFKQEIRSVLKIPKSLRTKWGIYKNLLGGVTTVVHHGPYLDLEQSPIAVIQNGQSLHSTAFEKHWILKLNNPLQRKQMVVIHTGEGTDKQSVNEINRLIKYNWFKRNIIGVHGVAMNIHQAKKIKALIWCPWSNQLLLDQQPKINELKQYTQILFGTDSTLTADWDFCQHLRLARSLNYLTASELFNSCTVNPADIWNLRKGRLEKDLDADLIILNLKQGAKPWDTFYSSSANDILMVIQKGKIRLFDESIRLQLAGKIDLNSYSEIVFNGSVKWVEGDLPGLVKKIKSYNSGISFPFAVN